VRQPCNEAVQVISVGATDLDGCLTLSWEEKMKTIQALAFLGAALIAACSEPQSVTAPAAEVVAAGFIGDRPYTWSLKCGGSGQSLSYQGVYAYWTWTENNIEIPGTQVLSFCAPNGSASGTGVRPANANGLYANVGNDGSTKRWTFDPAQPFSAQLTGKQTWNVYCYYCKGGKTTVSTKATLNLDS
jgi:hypothetical protein